MLGFGVLTDHARKNSLRFELEVILDYKVKT